MDTRAPRSRPAGLTLVEILMATAILAVVMIILIDFWRNGMGFFRTGANQAEISQGVRLSLANFERDIREAVEVLHYEDTPGYTNLHLRRRVGPFDKPEDEFIVYTWYKSKVTLKAGEFNCALCKDTFREAPDKAVKAEKVLIKGVDQYSARASVGLLPGAVDQNGRMWKSHIHAYNIFIDPGYMDKDFLTEADKDEKMALARYKNVDTPGGFEDPSKIVSFELKFFTNDDRNNVKVYRTIATIRARYYHQIYEQ